MEIGSIGNGTLRSQYISSRYTNTSEFKQKLLEEQGPQSPDRVTLSAESLQKSEEHTAEKTEPTRKVLMYQLAEYLREAEPGATVVMRDDIPAATQVWLDVPESVLRDGATGL